jgi:hypothetical protein
MRPPVLEDFETEVVSRRVSTETRRQLPQRPSFSERMKQAAANLVFLGTLTALAGGFAFREGTPIAECTWHSFEPPKKVGFNQSQNTLPWAEVLGKLKPIDRSFAGGTIARVNKISGSGVFRYDDTGTVAIAALAIHDFSNLGSRFQYVTVADGEEIELGGSVDDKGDVVVTFGGIVATGCGSANSKVLVARMNTDETQIDAIKDRFPLTESK